MRYRLLVLGDRVNNIGAGCPFVCVDMETGEQTFANGFRLPPGSELAYDFDGYMVGVPEFLARAWVQCPTPPEAIENG